jgi:hypothetical protein
MLIFSGSRSTAPWVSKGSMPISLANYHVREVSQQWSYIGRKKKNVEAPRIIRPQEHTDIPDIDSASRTINWIPQSMPLEKLCVKSLFLKSSNQCHDPTDPPVVVVRYFPVSERGPLIINLRNKVCVARKSPRHPLR